MAYTNKQAGTPVHSGSYRNAFAVTPDDNNDLTEPQRALYVSGAAASTPADVVVTMADGGDVTFSSVQPGTILPITVSRVKATGTTSLTVVALS